jgi:hypothetical protein
MIPKNNRNELYSRLEEKYPVSGSRSGSMASQHGGKETGPNLQALWKAQLLHLEDRLLDETLLQLYTLFDFSDDDPDIKNAVRDAFKNLHDSERSCSQGGDFDVDTYALFLFRNSWHRENPLDSASPLTGMDHLTRAGFFQKIPQDLTAWTQRFLHIERYHRLDVLESENRLERYRFLESASEQFSKSIKWTFDDVVMWLERQLLARQADEIDLGPLSHELAKYLENVLPTDFFHGEPFQPVVFALLKCHDFCLAETIEPAEQKHIDRIHAKRQIDSVLDLMRLVITKATHQQPLPETGMVLDQLQDEGFEIEHRGFRDPYEARMVPLADAERLDSTLLPLFLPVRDLHGQYETDLDLCKSFLADRHNELVKELIGECEAYQSAHSQPLPKALSVPRMIRFATSWSLAQFSWLPPELPPGFTEHVLKRLPSNAIRLLVRQRKGYEVKSRSAMTAMVDLEIRRQWEVLQGIAESRRIYGLHDYAQFARFALFRDAVRKFGPDPGPDLSGVIRFIREDFSPELVASAGRRRGIDTQQVEHHSLESVEEYVRNVVPTEMISERLGKSFEISEKERALITRHVVDKAVPAFYRLLTAYERHRLQLPRLSAKSFQIPWMVGLLAPPTAFLQEKVIEDLEQEFRNDPSRLFLAQHDPYLLDAGEWKAYLAWQTHRMTGGAPKRYLEEGDLDGLLSRLHQEAARVELAPGALFTESIQASLVEFLKPDRETPPGYAERIKELIPLLPQLNCAACGRMSCADFAGSILSGQSQLHQCPHLSSDNLRIATETLNRPLGATHENQLFTPTLPPPSRGRGLGSSPLPRWEGQGEGEVSGDQQIANGRAGSLLEQLSQRDSWRNSANKSVFQNVLSAKSQRARHLFLRQLRKTWEELPTKPQIFKCPDADEFYQELKRYLGYEAVERIREDERRFLIEHGEIRHQAEWQRLKLDQDWLTFANRARQSRPKLQSQDPEWIAGQHYKNVFFVEQLNARDRSLILLYRREQHQDGFGHWWNEDLLTMNLSDFRIRDWDDFSKIIKNAYWHQESSVPAMDAYEQLQLEFSSDLSSPQLSAALLRDWLHEQQTAMLLRAEQLGKFRGNAGRHTEIHDVGALRAVIEALADELGIAGSRTTALQCAPLLDKLSSEDQVLIERLKLWETFQNEGFLFSRDFTCRWDELTTAERELFENNHSVPLVCKGNHSIPPFCKGNHSVPPFCKGGSGGISCNKEQLVQPATPQSSGERAVFAIAGWKAPLQERKRLIFALISACIERRFRELAEYRWTQQTPVTLLYGGDILDIHKVGTLAQELLQKNPLLAGRIVEDALCEAIHTRQCEFLKPSTELPVHPVSSRRLKLLQETCPQVMELVERLIEQHPPMDRERLFHYLFLLAKMEGNLDALTALLREIRETSDIIEAAWLRFTQERLSGAGSPRALPGLGLGVPLLASGLKDQDVVNEALRSGISRKAHKNTSAAYNEIIQLIRYHVLLQLEKSGNTEQILEEMHNTEYDLSRLDGEALKTAIRREWDRRERFRDQKIWIFATVAARRLAAQHRGLYEAERDFHKIRSDLLKEGRDGAESYGEIMSRRGVALGQIKEEMYRLLSDLLEEERILSFQRRIRQIVGQLDEKREQIYFDWLKGEVNRQTVFYVLRQYQKRDQEPTWDDFQRFLRDHWFKPLAEFRSTPRHDREERASELDRRFESLLGVSLLKLEAQSNTLASQEIAQWAAQEFHNLKTAIGRK